MATLQRRAELVRKLFDVFVSHPEGLQAGEALKQLANSVKMTPEEAGFYETSGALRFDKIVRFSTIASGHAGWFAKNKGVWSVTDATGSIDSPGSRVAAFAQRPYPSNFDIICSSPCAHEPHAILGQGTRQTHPRSKRSAIAT